MNEKSIQPRRVMRETNLFAAFQTVFGICLTAGFVTLGCSSSDGQLGAGGAAGATQAGTPNLGGGAGTGTPSSGGNASQGGASGGTLASGGTSGGGASAGASFAGAGPSFGGAAGSGGTTLAGGTNSAGATPNGGASGGATSPGGGSSGAASGATAVVASGVRWVGRVDVSDPAAPKFAWSGTGFVGKVSGATISVKLKSDGGSDPIYFQPVIDGMTKPRFSVASSEGVKTVVLGTGLSEAEHLVELYRETEGKSNFATSTFLGFESGTPKDPPAYTGKLIEIIGDSISAGYGNLGSEQHPNAGQDPNGGCRFTTETQSAYMTYGALAARALGADASILAASGWGVYSDNSGDRNNVLPKLWSGTVGGNATPAWSFAQKPQAVVINLGTNDFSASMTLAKDPFTTAYKAFVTDIRAKYPAAWIYCAIGPMLYGEGLTNATAYIKALVQDITAQGDSKVKVLELGQQDASKGTGCDWHPNVAENQRMADALTRELKATLSW